ncbi:hypothetical protein ACCC88_00270 [Sphingomonas sp. Sphisp140]|uniref:hypothetical protein n=1 Tax=unclassified Sphingomonas TaxID=196159 RepID=UPI0039AF08EC
MSLLSSPQGTPERVWSVVAGLHALGGDTDRATFNALLNPGYIKDGEEVRAKDLLAGDASNAASALGLIDLARDQVKLGEGYSVTDYAALADHVHDYLVDLPSEDIEATLLEAYAWLAAECDRVGNLGWFYDWPQKDFAEKAGREGRSDTSFKGSINPTNITAWRRWLTFIGLGVPLPLHQTPELPVPTIRLARELERASTSGEISAGAEITAEAFLAFIAKHMPYLDRGRLFVAACQRIGHPTPARQASPLLSLALRDLHDEGTIRLALAGDAGTHIRLTPDPAHKFQAFTTVIVTPETAS